jgi:hypothetical protein
LLTINVKEDVYEAPSQTWQGFVEPKDLSEILPSKSGAELQRGIEMSEAFQPSGRPFGVLNIDQSSSTF